MKPDRYHVLPLTIDELAALKRGEPVIAPFHRGSTYPCGGCGQHNVDFVAVVVLGRPPLERIGTMLRTGLSVLNAALSEREWGNLVSVEDDEDLHRARAPTLFYEGVTIVLSIVPPEWHVEQMRKSGQRIDFGARWSAELALDPPAKLPKEMVP
jgi:hypothetical protein